MRRAEVTILTILLTIVGSLFSMYAEREYGVTVTIEKSLEVSKEDEAENTIATDK